MTKRSCFIHGQYEEETCAQCQAALPPVRSEPMLATGECVECHRPLTNLCPPCADELKKNSASSPGYRSVTELCADHPSLAEYVRQMENELAQLRRCAGCHWAHHAPYTYPCTECAGGDMFCTANKEVTGR